MMTATAAKLEARRLRDELSTLAASLDHLDHAIARDLNDARSCLFAAWSKLRAAERDEQAAITSKGPRP